MHAPKPSWTGYVTVTITGKLPELFFQKCVNHGIEVWEVKKINDTKCEGTLRLKDLSLAKRLRKEGNYKLSFSNTRGLPFLFKRLLKRKEILWAILLSSVLIFCLSNLLWKITIVGVTPEVEDKINKTLNKYEIHHGKWLFSLEEPTLIQQYLLKEIPELLWIGVEQKGTTLTLEGVEKDIVERRKDDEPRHLTANKNGIIEQVYVSKGVPIVNVNDYVTKGDLLVSGDLTVLREEEGEDENSHNLVAAEGEIFARTWYETKITVPLITNDETLTGQYEKKYYLKFGKFKLPIWGKIEQSFEDVKIDEIERNFQFVKWQLPISFVQSYFQEKVYNKRERTQEEARLAGILQAKETLKLKLGPNSEIISEKVLHESIENGKVKLNLFLTVIEDISRAQPITQGD